MKFATNWKHVRRNQSFDDEIFKAKIPKGSSTNDVTENLICLLPSPWSCFLVLRLKCCRPKMPDTYDVTVYVINGPPLIKEI